MARLTNKLIYLFYYLLFFLVPLVFYPYSSELFEFNKIIVTYICVIIIVALWLIKMVLARKLIFKRTLLDIPILIFLTAQLLSTVVSIDTRTSIFGYYSRFHGGLLSSIVYSLGYWAYVTNFKRKQVITSIYVLVVTTALVCIYGVLQHFGIDKDVWVQDVQTRVFSTFGQPNWLAAWIVAFIPLIWGFAFLSTYHKDSKQDVDSNRQLIKFWLWIGFSSLFFLTLLYSKSRSGLGGIVVSLVIFWAVSFLFWLKFDIEKIKDLTKTFLVVNFIFLVLALVVGTPWTPSIGNLLNKKGEKIIPEQVLGDEDSSRVKVPLLETGGTESGEIRSIVWRGAVDIWKNYPILGSGVETFAFSYYQYRPEEHNLVSEWDYLYNRAHNEYLNVMATTGTIGILTYLILIFASIYQISIKDMLAMFGIGKVSTKVKRKVDIDALSEEEVVENRTINISLVSGYFSILATNFLGFSVVPVGILFFLYPAMAVCLKVKDESLDDDDDWFGLTVEQKSVIVVVSLVALFFVYTVLRYWLADLNYSYGKMNNDAFNLSTANKHLTRAVNLSKKEAIFWNELSKNYALIAVKYAEQGDQNQAVASAKQAISNSDRAIELSPANVNLKRDRASVYIKLAAVNPELLNLAREALEAAVEQAPTDAKLYYNLGLAYLRTGMNSEAISTFNKTIRMKPNYTKAYYALGLMYVDEGEDELARKNFQFILDNLDPTYGPAIEELEELDK